MKLEKEEKPDIYIIPSNYKDRGGIFGLFKTRNFVEGGLCAGIICVLLLPVLMPLNMSIAVKTIIIAIPCIVIFVAGIIGFHDEPWISALLYLIHYKSHKRKLSYQIRSEEKHIEHIEEEKKSRNI